MNVEVSSKSVKNKIFNKILLNSQISSVSMMQSTLIIEKSTANKISALKIHY